MLLPLALFFLSVGSTFSFSDVTKTNFLYATAAVSGLSILLQTGLGFGELYQTGRYFVKFLFSKFLSGLLGTYGTDMLLTIGKYSTWTLSDLKEKTGIRGRFWKLIVYCFLPMCKTLKYCVFGDPYSGTFQVRYKSTAIWLAPEADHGEADHGEGYGGLIEEAKVRLGDKRCYHHSVNIRNTTMSLRWNTKGLSTDGELMQPTDEERENGYDSMVEVLLYSSQANNYGGLFHHQFGPVATQRRFVVELVAMMEILAKDSFVVQENGNKAEPCMRCISFEDTMTRVLRNGEVLNFKVHTGASYG